MSGAPEPALRVEGLTTCLDGREGMRVVLRDIDISIARGRAFALLGESGSGKTCLVHSILGLHPGVPGTVRGSARVFGKEVLPDHNAFVRFDGETFSRVEKSVNGWNREARNLWSDMLGSKVTLVPQDATTALSPFRNIGRLLQLAILRGNPRLDADAALLEGRGWLERVRMYEVESVMGRYVHELSGGMAQRVAIALAMAPGPELLIADEPTTGLDATLRVDLIALMSAMVKEQGVTLFLVTHDNGAARLLADDVAVLYGGMVVESGPVEKVLGMGPWKKHPYTRYLLESERLLIEGAQIPRIRREEDEGRGCPFSPMCAVAQKRCRQENPILGGADQSGHRVACWVEEG